MPRFVANPITVEAVAYDGHVHMMPEPFRMAVRRQLHGGHADVMCGGELRRCSHGDWIVRGPDGQFSVVKSATFEMLFTEQRPAKSEKRKELANV